jgi:hypothetical protein
MVMMDWTQFLGKHGEETGTNSNVVCVIAFLKKARRISFPRNKCSFSKTYLLPGVKGGRGGSGRQAASTGVLERSARGLELVLRKSSTKRISP